MTQTAGIFSVYDVVPFSVIDNEKLVYLSHSVSFQTIMEQLLRAADITPNIAYSESDLNFASLISGGYVPPLAHFLLFQTG